MQYCYNTNKDTIPELQVIPINSKAKLLNSKDAYADWLMEEFEPYSLKCYEFRSGKIFLRIGYFPPNTCYVVLLSCDNLDKWYWYESEQFNFDTEGNIIKNEHDLTQISECNNIFNEIMYLLTSNSKDVELMAEKEIDEAILQNIAKKFNLIS